jgi:hypothetical protein
MWLSFTFLPTFSEYEYFKYSSIYAQDTFRNTSRYFFTVILSYNFLTILLKIFHTKVLNGMVLS